MTDVARDSGFLDRIVARQTSTTTSLSHRCRYDRLMSTHLDVTSFLNSFLLAIPNILSLVLYFYTGSIPLSLIKREKEWQMVGWV